MVLLQLPIRRQINNSLSPSLWQPVNTLSLLSAHWRQKKITTYSTYSLRFKDFNGCTNFAEVDAHSYVCYSSWRQSRSLPCFKPKYLVRPIRLRVWLMKSTRHQIRSRHICFCLRSPFIGVCLPVHLNREGKHLTKKLKRKPNKLENTLSHYIYM